MIEEPQEMEDEVVIVINRRVNKARQLGCKETIHRYSRRSSALKLVVMSNRGRMLLDSTNFPI